MAREAIKWGVLDAQIELPFALAATIRAAPRSLAQIMPADIQTSGGHCQKTKNFRETSTEQFGLMQLRTIRQFPALRRLQTSES